MLTISTDISKRTVSYTAIQFNSIQFYFKNKQTNRCMYNK